MLYKKTIIWTLLLSLFLVTVATAQNHEVTGTVTDAETGETLPGVNITVLGTTLGTTSDMDGNYILSSISDNDVLIFSYVGYERIDVAVEGRVVINVQLTRDIQLLDDVIVVGYGVQRRSDITGSISSVTATDFNEGSVLSANQLIQGRAAGVNIVPTTGQPGGGSNISIRGLGSLTAGTNPLYVIDGLPIENSPVISSNGEGLGNSRAQRDPLSSMNPQDIESIEILKDASATAIYGARGANGVILITTKDGHRGQTQINYSTSLSIQNRANKLDLLDAEEYRFFINDIIDKGAATSGEKVTEIQNGGTDWQNAISRDNAFMQDHNFSVSGGDNDRNYRMSLNYLDQDGIAINSAFERYSASASFNQKYERFNIGLKLNTSYTNDQFIPNSFSGNEGSGAFYAATYFDPTLSIYDLEGNFQSSQFLDLVNNPVAQARGTDSESNSYRTYGSVIGEYEITNNLLASIRVGGDINSEQKDVYLDRRTNAGRAEGGIATKLEGKNSNYLFEGLLRFVEDFERQSVNFVGGVSYQAFNNRGLTSIGRGFPSDATRANNMNLADPQSFITSSNLEQNTLLSFLGRLNYSFLDKYLLTVSFRSDGSSRFGEENKFGYFPSAAISWRLDNEDFFENLRDILSTFKPRISWGITGNQEIGNYNSLVTFGAGGPTFINQEPVSTIDPNRIPNPDLKWETTEQFNIGIDLGLFEDRVSGSIDWFHKETTDMLLNLPVPQSTGFGSKLTNVGEMSNTGIELSLTTHNVARRNFSWRSRINLSRVINEVQDLGELDRIITGGAHFSNNIFLIQNGLPARSFLGYEVVGIWQETDDFSQISNESVVPGNLKYRDVNNDGTINDEDRVILGDSYPDLQFSVSNSFQYRNFQMNVFFEGALGFEMLNNNLVDTYFPVTVRRNRYSEPIINRWTPENPSNKYPSFVAPNTQGDKRVNSYTVEDASYLKLQSVSLTYNFPSGFSRAFRNLSVSLTGQNLLTITNYSGLDPSFNPNGTGYSRIDFNAYPPARTITFGLNLEF